MNTAVNRILLCSDVYHRLAQVIETVEVHHSDAIALLGDWPC